MQSMLYFYRTMKTPLVFAEAFDAYVMKVGDLQFYANDNSSMPYVQLFANGRIPFNKNMPYSAHGRAEIASQVSRNVSVGGVVNYGQWIGFSSDGEWSCLDQFGIEALWCPTDRYN